MKKLYLARHERAGDAVTFAQSGKSDEQRPLTEEGVQRAHKNSKKLQVLIEGVDLIVTSPYKRAIQTSLPYEDAFNPKSSLESEYLVPYADVTKTLEYLNHLFEKHSSIMAFGHNPHMQCLASYLLSGRETAVLDFKKGAVLALENSGRFSAGGACLSWFMKARQISLLESLRKK